MSVRQSAIVSLTAQISIGIFTIVGLIAGVDKKDLVPIFILEVVTQFIELLWYAINIVYVAYIQTWSRYLDWFFSTPAMLISTVLFFMHRRNVEYSEFLESGRLYMLVAINWLMLSSGFAAEAGVLQMNSVIVLGFLALFSSFSIMATFVDWNDELSVILFSAMLFVWSLYGVAAMFK